MRKAAARPRVGLRVDWALFKLHLAGNLFAGAVLTAVYLWYGTIPTPEQVAVVIGDWARDWLDWLENTRL